MSVVRVWTAKDGKGDTFLYSEKPTRSGDTWRGHLIGILSATENTQTFRESLEDPIRVRLAFDECGIEEIPPTKHDQKIARMDAWVHTLLWSLIIGNILAWVATIYLVVQRIFF